MLLLREPEHICSFYVIYFGLAMLVILYLLKFVNRIKNDNLFFSRDSENFSVRCLRDTSCSSSAHSLSKWSSARPKKADKRSRKKIKRKYDTTTKEWLPNIDVSVDQDSYKAY